MSSMPHAAPDKPYLGPKMEPKEPLVLATPPGFALAPCVALSPIGILPPLCYEPIQGVLQVALPSSLGSVQSAGLPGFQPAIPNREVLLHSVPGEPALLMFGLAKGPLADAAIETVRWMLGLDEDLSLFHHLCTTDRELGWVAEQKAGRMLRSATVFEDLVKVLITTQRPKQAHVICERLCQAFGPITMLSRPAFPEPQHLASARPDELQDDLQLGSLGHQIWQLAVLCAEGRPAPQTLKRQAPSLSAALCADDEALFDDLVGEELAWQERLTDLLLTLPGFGVRSVPKMMRLLGCYDLVEVHHHAVRAFAKQYPPRRKSKEPESNHDVMERLFKRLDGFGVYRSLAQSLLLLPRSA